MSKLILFLSFISLGLLLTFGLVAPDSPVMWLASTSDNFAILRAAMMILLLTLLMTNPPRSPYLRSLVGTASLLLVSWCLNATYNNEMKLVDSLSLLEVSISAGLAVLERRIETPQTITIPRKRKNRSTSHA